MSGARDGKTVGDCLLAWCFRDGRERDPGTALVGCDLDNATFIQARWITDV